MNLLDINAPAFSFVSMDRFQQSKYDDDTTGAISNVPD